MKWTLSWLILNYKPNKKANAAKSNQKQRLVEVKANHFKFIFLLFLPSCVRN